MKKCINRIQLQLWIFGWLFFGSLIIASAKPPVIVINPNYRLLLDSNKGTIESLPGQNSWSEWQGVAYWRQNAIVENGFPNGPHVCPARCSCYECLL